jgi:hypothetical protein
MISVATAKALRDAGLRWTPVSGDRFVVTSPEMADEVFVLSEMTVEVHDFPHGRVIGFNGTTEWALDSVEHDEALWLPRETQLRELLGGTFRTLSRDADRRWQVALEVNGRESTVTDSDAEQAYALALLSLLTG